MMLHRKLTEEEIKSLEKQNCLAIDGWDKVKISDDFVASHIKNVTFSGVNYLGLFSQKKTLPSGAVDMAGIYHAHLHNCTIGNQCYIKNIGTSISNYIIQENVIIQNIGTLIVDGESSFGNGVEVSPVNEAGGREVLIYNELSVHTAYLMAFYRYRPKLIEAIEGSIQKYVKLQTSLQGSIGQNSILINCGTLKNVKIGSSAQLQGVAFLNNGTIQSNLEAPTYIGQGVNAGDFIISSGSRVSDGAYLRHCFVGEGCEIANSFTADNSLFFSNSQCLQGEACNIFAGPYTVTHHKSTLLIAGYYSFFNAGSGTNQSNHMYKLGPVHQGVIERGGRTGSNAYVLWPAQIGAFTMILGNHYSNPNISALPFSYLIEEGGKSVLIPGQNLFNAGTARDVKKWPKRDKRMSMHHLDYIISDALSPYTIDKIIEGKQVLEQLKQKANPDAKNIMYKNTQLSLGSINRGIKLYEQALIKYVGDELIVFLEQEDFEKIRGSAIKDKQTWLDLGGLICSKASLGKFMEDIENSKISIKQWDGFYKAQFAAYLGLKQAHALQVLKNCFHIDISSCPFQDINSFLEEYIENNTKIKNAIIIDAKKEFSVKSKISFGKDGNDEIQDMDFEAVRGSINSQPFMEEISLDYENVNQKIQSFINQLANNDTCTN